MSTVNQVIAALEKIRDAGHGRKQLILHDTNLPSSIEAANIEVFAEGRKLTPTIFFEYGDLDREL